MASDTEVKARRGTYRRLKKLQISLIIIGLLLMLLSFEGFLPKSPTSILCDDPKIHKIYQSDTIPMSVLLLTCTVGPFLNILLVEYVAPHNGGRKLSEAAIITWKIMKDVWYFELLVIMVIEFFKMTISEARPHFMQTCSPELSPELCDAGYVLVSWSNCSNPLGVSHGRLMDTMKSFPSGHAGLGAFSATFMMWYLATRLQGKWSRYLPVWGGLLWGFWGSLCGVSRIWDNRHFWWDVLAGAVMGIAGAYLTVCFIRRHLASAAKQSTERAAAPQSTVP